MTNASHRDARGTKRPDSRSTRSLGRSGEAIARRHLEANGLKVIDTNWRCREGEIDIVALDGRHLVVVEVKTRRSRRYGHAIEAVTVEKHLRLRRLALLWAAEHEARVDGIRVDVVGVEVNGADAVVDHRRGVIP